MSFFVIAAAVLLCSCTGGQADERCFVRVRVLDGMSASPICGAGVTVPEAGVSMLSDADGLTGTFAVPVIPDSEYDRLLPCPMGRATLIVTAEGFTPYLLLYMRTEANASREIEVLLFQGDGTLPVFSVIEAPPAEWAKMLIEKAGI